MKIELKTPDFTFEMDSSLGDDPITIYSVLEEIDGQIKERGNHKATSGGRLLRTEEMDSMIPIIMEKWQESISYQCTSCRALEIEIQAIRDEYAEANEGKKEKKGKK